MSKHLSKYFEKKRIVRKYTFIYILFTFFRKEKQNFHINNKPNIFKCNLIQNK